ncbi:SRPBCC family protein (plasmid) [Rhodococcus sp. USK10]|uniref:SRPBCC family protein n=1 Tax=Rhodococcus sp. USK10 TaxID=2789739 RepID=UPI001C5D97B9|nr:SRPBCC family protein [Rhodococcus sp. USK10]QYA99890.1 SRPBCC family protein [Rhodococcus sp. USK10]
MSTVTESVDVDVPLHVAYDQWTQFESFPQFMKGVTEVRQLDDTHTHWTVEIGGQRREFDATITEQRPDERVAWRSDAGPIHAGVITFAPLDNTHTRVTAEMDLDPDGVAEHVADTLGILSRRMTKDLERYKWFVEDRGTLATGWRGVIDHPEP